MLEISTLFAETTTKADAIQFTQDPLACILALRESLIGCHSHQIVGQMRTFAELIRVKKGPDYEVLVHKQGFIVPDVTDVHVNTATEIRNYYGHRLFLNRMMGKPPLSGFRRTLEKILSNYDDLIVEVEELKILVKLPEFYLADRYMDYLSETYDCDIANYRQMTAPTETIGHLPYIGKLHISTRQHKICRYFFQYELNKIVVLEVQATNNLLPLIEKIVHTDSFVLKSATFVSSQILNTNYGFYILTDWQLI
jgi:hypothetical protein